MVGLGLYWGEGAKAERCNLSISNSDPRVIRVAMRWFSVCLDVDEERFKPRLFISDAHRSREDVLLDFWSHELGIPREQFANTVYIRRGKKIYENHETYYGVLALNVLKGTELRYRILALIEQVSKLTPV